MCATTRSSIVSRSTSTADSLKIAEYQDTAAERAFVHTEIYPRYEGSGYGRTLVQGALDASRDEGFGILPMCGMVQHFIETRPEYQSLVPQWARERFGLRR